MCRCPSASSCARPPPRRARADRSDPQALAPWRGPRRSCADGLPGLVPVRDSKVPEGPALILPAYAWAPFVVALEGDGPTC
ncbi:DUF397 domain-containing protein [Streptomyces sp. NPDC096311]|uniref:DUF397 domain-containing protein n=1 Tax=Streptomyces sp. NPDC096311 TaxID=3366083 RepID=UPI00382E29C9